MNPIVFFKCLSDETRLKSVLLVSYFAELCVCDLIEALQLSQPKVSRHLAELRKSGVVIDERRGKWVFYRLHPELPEWALLVLKKTLDDNKAYIANEIRETSEVLKVDKRCYGGPCDA